MAITNSPRCLIRPMSGAKKPAAVAGFAVAVGLTTVLAVFAVLAALGVCAVANEEATSITSAKAKPGTDKLDLSPDKDPTLRLRCGSGLRALKN